VKHRAGVAWVIAGLVLLPTSASANGVHQGTEANLLLMAAAGVAFVGGAALWRMRRWRGAAIGSMTLAILLAGAGFAVPRLGEEPPGTRVDIVEPANGEDVPASDPITVSVRLDGGAIATSPQDQEGGHLHLYVDGNLQQMPYSTEAQVTLERGPHEIRVEYVDHQHVSFDPPIEASIRVSAV
jgi:hypothetical protein